MSRCPVKVPGEVLTRGLRLPLQYWYGASLDELHEHRVMRVSVSASITTASGSSMRDAAGTVSVAGGVSWSSMATAVMIHLLSNLV